MFDFDISLLLLIMLAGLLSGFGKTTGLNVLGIFTVTMLSLFLPAKEAVGILLPILLIGDLIAVTYYRKTVVWKHLFSLVPWILVGILIGYFVLWNVDNGQLKILLGYMVLSLNLFQFIRDLMGSRMDQALPNSVWFSAVIGMLAGFATMIGNVAGAVMAVYLLSRRLPKNEFVGTGAWFFLFVNVIKVPFYIHLDMITSKSLLLNTMAIPAVAVGTFVGIKVLPLIPQQMFKWIILALGTAGALRLIVSDLFDYLLVWHIAAGVVCILAGLLAVLVRNRKGLRTLSGKIYRGAYTVLFITTMALAIMQWENEAYLLFIGAFSYGIALFGYLGTKKRWHNWKVKQIGGMIGSYMGMIAAVFAVIGSNILRVSNIPVFWLWSISTMIGAAIIFWIGYRYSYFTDDQHSLTTSDINNS